MTRILRRALLAVPTLAVSMIVSAHPAAAADPAPLPTTTAPGTIFVGGYGLDDADYRATVGYPPGGRPYEVPVYSDLLQCLAVDPHGNVYICDRFSVTVYHPDGSPNTRINTEHPISLTVAADGTVYLAQLGDDDGTQGLYAIPPGGGSWRRIGDFRYPDAVAQGPDGDLYVADQKALWRIHPDGTGQTRLGGGAFSYSLGLAVAANGDVYGVGQSDSTKIVIAPAGGGRVRTITGLRDADTPVFDVDGSLLVTEYGANQVTRMAPDGSDRRVALAGTSGELAVYAPSSPATLAFTSAPPSPAHVGDSYRASASGPSSKPVRYSATAASNGVCTVSADGSVEFVGAGVCTVVARQAGDASHPAARAVRQRIRVVGT